MYEANYPEILKACYAINGMYYFSSFFVRSKSLHFALSSCRMGDYRLKCFIFFFLTNARFPAPKVFAFAFNILKNILTGNTLSKFIIFKADPNKWKPVLSNAIDRDQYPAFFGGELKDDDGNPKCITKASLTRK